MSNEIPTPRTDAATEHLFDPEASEPDWVTVEFARQLERELHEANEKIKVITTDPNYEGGTYYWIAKHDKMAVALAKCISQLHQWRQVAEKLAEELRDEKLGEYGWSSSSAALIAFQKLKEQEQSK